MKFWLVTLFLGVLTMLGRTSFILWFSHWEMPAWLQKALRFVPVAAFSAIVAPAILRPDGAALDISIVNPRIIASFVAIITAWYIRNLVLTIVIGMLAFWLAGWLL